MAQNMAWIKWWWWDLHQKRECQPLYTPQNTTGLVQLPWQLNVVTIQFFDSTCFKLFDVFQQLRVRVSVEETPIAQHSTIIIWTTKEHVDSCWPNRTAQVVSSSPSMAGARIWTGTRMSPTCTTWRSTMGDVSSDWRVASLIESGCVELVLEFIKSFMQFSKTIVPKWV